MKTKLLRLAFFLKPYRGYLLLALVAALGEVGADLLFPWPLKVLFDHVFAHRPLSPGVGKAVASLFGRQPLDTLRFVLAAILVISTLNAAASFLQDVLMPRVGHWVMHDMRRNLYWQIQGLSLAYHDETRLGDLMSTLMGDIQAIRETIESAVIGVVMNTLTLSGMVVVMFAIDWRFALLALCITPPLSAVAYRFTRRIKQASRDVRRHEGAVASVAQEVFSSIRVVQAFTREDYEQARFEHENQERVSAGIRVRTLQAQRRLAVDLLMGAGTVIVLGYGTLHVLAGTLMPGVLLVFLTYLTRLYKPLRGLSKQSDLISRASVGFERMVDILETEPGVRDLPGARPAPPLRGAIAFENVSFGYRSEQPVLHNITFNAEPGQLIALVGATGAGKTTLVSMIPRFHDPAEGRVRIDGDDVRAYSLASLRRQMSLVLQETVLFYGTIRDNIVYGRPEASTEEVIAAASQANADEFIRRLPEGYDTIVGERGVTLSGGQRQRLAIARAIIRDAPIVLLDEPTTGLDADSEALVLEGLSRLVAGRTAVVIAHRLATIARADVIFVLDRGRIVEQGTHDALLGADGRYAAFYRLQFRAQIPVSSR